MLALQHSPTDSLGRLEPILAGQGLQAEVCDVVEQPLPRTWDYDAVVVLGGDQSVNDLAGAPCLRREAAYLRDAVEREIPCLGICLGAQLLAHLLGAAVHPGRRLEFGFDDVQLTGEGERDPLFRGLPGLVPVFHWHQETFDLPPGGVPLGHNRHGECQAFRHGRHVYGIQHHIELTPEMIRVWLDKAGRQPELLQGGEPDLLARVTAEHAVRYPAYAAHSRLVFENFLGIACPAPL